MAAAQSLKATAWTPEAIAAFAPVCEADPFGPLCAPVELLADSYLHEYERGHQAALVAITRHVNAGGTRVHVQGIVNQDRLHPLQLRHVMAAIEGTARNYGADLLTMCTRHPELAASAHRWGGTITGAVLSKYLRGH